MGPGPTDDVELPIGELDRLDAALTEAIAKGTTAGLRMLGFGEISVVVAWPTDEPAFAVKTAPISPGPAAVDAFAGLVAEYRRSLADAGVATVPTAVVAGPSGRGYLVQRLLPPGTIADAALRDADDALARRLLGEVVGHVVGAVRPGLGIDAHIANWAVTDDGSLALLDVGTPMLRDTDGRDRVDLAAYVAAMPCVSRPLVRRIAPSLLDPYFDVRGVLADAAFNLQKVGLAGWQPLFVELANGHLERPLTIDGLRRAYRNDARLWQLMQAARRLDRLWQRHARRRPYGFLLPPPMARHLR